jgi:hypothetical protein
MPALGRLLLAGYVLAFVFLNLVALLISSFYQKKFDQPSPRAGFLVACGLALLYTITVLFAAPVYAPLAVVKVLLLFGASIASASSAVALYYTMKRVRK